MPDKVQQCKLYGRVFEDQVAALLRDMGFHVFQDLYVPYFPGSKNHAQIDIVAVDRGMLVTLECKRLCGILVGSRVDRTWRYTSSRGTYEICNPLKQNFSHKSALEANLGVPVIAAVLFPDTVSYNGDGRDDILYFSALRTALLSMSQLQLLDANSMEAVIPNLMAWASPSADVKLDHVLLVNSYRNGEVKQSLDKNEGVFKYCVFVDNRAFYAFTGDDGVHYGTEKIDEATLFDTEDEAWEMAGMFAHGEVCSLELGYVERLSDIYTDGSEDMTPDEFADMVGARPG